MKPRTLIYGVLLTTLALGAQALGADPVDAAHAAHDAHGHAVEMTPVEHVNFWQFIAAIGVFGLAFIILSVTAWPKISKGLSDRENKIRSEIAAAEQARKDAQTALVGYERSLAEAKAEAQRMIDATKAEQSRMAADLRAAAEKEVGQMRESALRSIDAAKRAAVNDLYNEAASIATTVASKILQREVNEQDQRRLVEESIAEFTRDYARSS